MSSTGDESVLPIEFDGSLDPSQLPNVTLGNHSIMQAKADGGAHSPKPGMSPSGRLSPGKGRTMKEYDQQISLLKKENFSLKMRIFYMEDRMQQQYGGNQDVFKTNIELRVQVDTLKKDLTEKQVIIQRASHAMDMLTANKQQAEDSIRQKCDSEYQELVDSLRAQVEQREKDCEKSRQEASIAKDRVKELEADLKSANQNVKDWKQKFESAEFEVQSLTGQLKLSQQANRDLELEKGGVAERARRLEQRLEELSQQVARKDRDIQNLSAAIDQPFSVDNPLPSLDVLHLQDKCQDQKDEIEGLLKKIANLEDMLKDKDSDLKNFEDKLNRITSNTKDTTAKVEELEQEVQQKDRLLEKYKKSIEGIMRKLTDKDEQCTTLTAKCIKWKEQCSDLEKKVKALEAEKEEVVRLSLQESVLFSQGKQRDQCELQESRAQLENAIECLGRKEGELTRFREQLRTAMDALIQSEHAVEALQAQLKAERAEYDNKLRQQALQFQLSLSFSQDADEEVTSLKKKVSDLQNLTADQNVVNLALGREKAELEKSVAQLSVKNDDVEVLKKEHGDEVQKLEREIEALKLELNGKEMMIESIQHHPLVMETSRRETLMARQPRPSDFPKRPNVLDIETIWLDLLEDMKKTLNTLRVEVHSRSSLDGFFLQALAKGDGATADLLVSEIQSIQKVYHQLEKGVEKNSQLHEALLQSLRGSRQSSTESPDSSSCQDGGPSTLHTSDRHNGDHTDSTPAALRQTANNSSPPSACPFPNRSSNHKASRSLQTPSPCVDTDSLVKHYLRTSSQVLGTPEKPFEDSSCPQTPTVTTTSTDIPAGVNTPLDQSTLAKAIPGAGTHQTHNRSAQNSLSVSQRSHRSLPPSPLVSSGEQVANTSGQGHNSKRQSLTDSPFSTSGLHLSHLTDSTSPNSKPARPPTADHRESSPSSLLPLSRNLSECNADPFPSELGCDARGRRVTFDLSSDLGLTDDAKEGHLKQTHYGNGNVQLESFAEDAEAADFDDTAAPSFMDVIHAGSFRFEAEDDSGRRSGAGDTSAASSRDSNSLTDASFASTLKNASALLSGQVGGFGDVEGEEDGAGDNLRGCWADELERYRVTQDQEAHPPPTTPDATRPPNGTNSSLSPGHQQQLHHQHQQVIAAMSAHDLRDLIAQLQQDLIDSVRQNHALRDQVLHLKETSSANESQIKAVEEKLQATENTVRYQAIRIKSYKAALAGSNGSLGGSTASVERARASHARNGSLPSLSQDVDPGLEGSLTDIQSRDGSPSQSLVNGSTLSARSRRASSSVPSGLCFAGGHNTTTASQTSGLGDVTSPSSFSPGKLQPGLVENRSALSSSNGVGVKNGASPEGGQPPYDIIDGISPAVPSSSSLAAEDTSFYASDPTYTSLIDTTLFNKRLSLLDKTNSAANTTMNVDKLQARIAQLEQMNAALKEEIRLVTDLCLSHGVELGGGSGSGSTDPEAQGKDGPYANISSRDELLRKHLIEIRQLRQRLERLDLGNDPEQHLIFQTHIHQRIRHQESLIVQLQKQMEEKEEKWQRESAETQHRLQREKRSELERAERAAKSVVEMQEARVKELEEQLATLREDRAEHERQEAEANAQLREEKRAAEQELARRETEILDLEKSLFGLELAKEDLEKRVERMRSEGEGKDAEAAELRERAREQKEAARATRNALQGLEEEAARERERREAEAARLERRVEAQERELARARRGELEASETRRAYEDGKRALELRLVGAEEACKQKQEAIYQANRQMGSLRDQAEASERSLASCREDLRSCQEDLRACQEDLRACQDGSRACRESLGAREEKLQKRDRQLQHLVKQYKRLDVAYTKLQYKLEEKTLALTSLKRVSKLYEAASKRDASEDLTQSLLQELMETKRQVADLVARLEDKAGAQPTVTVKTYGSTVLTSCTDTTTKTTVTGPNPNTPSEDADLMDDKSSAPVGDIDEALEQLSVSMHERFGREGSLYEVPTLDTTAPPDPALREQNENLKKELSRLQCRYDLLDHKVKEQDSRLQASSVRKKDWEKSLCRQLIKTTRELEQAKENIDCTKKMLHPSSSLPLPSPSPSSASSTVRPAASSRSSDHPRLFTTSRGSSKGK